MVPAPESLVVRGISASFAPFLVVLSLQVTSSYGQGAPDSLSFQGRLTDVGGVPADTTVDMTFKLYDGSTQIWMETISDVEVVNGILSVTLGGATPLDTMAFDRPFDVGITIGSQSEMTPRTPLAAAPYALGIRGLHAVWAEDGDVNESFNLLGGVAGNSITAGSVGSIVLGGGGRVYGSAVEANTLDGDYSNIVGGAKNVVVGNFSTVAGGYSNSATGHLAVVGGGQENEATELNATVAGGWVNRAHAEYATIGGGEHNVAEGNWSTVPGGGNNRAAGEYSLAAGFNSVSRHEGSFVWADRSTTSVEDTFATSAANQFLIRATGGVGIGTRTPSNPLEVGTDSTNGNGAHVTAAGDWVNGSSIDFKDGFREIDKNELLERLANLSVTQWHYKGHEDVNHLGATAEEFRATFGLGHDPRYISTVDADGVALAAIQALYERVVALEAELAALKSGR